MTTVTAPSEAASPLVAPPTARLRWVLTDARAVTVRNLRHWMRQPQLLVFSTVQPVMFVLLFRYVFGGAIAGLPAGMDYVNYLLPGIFVQAVAFGATQASVGLAEDVSGGIIDRFRSLPMARSAVLAGRTLSDLIRNTFVVLLMTGVGYLVGFRFQAGLLASVGAIATVVLFGFALSWIFSFIGLSAKGAETAQATGFVAIFPLVFASSAFVPLETMPGWLQAFARAQPVTNVINAARALANGGPTARPVLYAALWITGILAVFIPLAVWRYRRSE
ncbi:MAG: ABC transporter permease [Nitriliruptorales bacterium]|nr:ABC transporter permease [Nitriliruptorales bacterium]